MGQGQAAAAPPPQPAGLISGKRLSSSAFMRKLEFKKAGETKRKARMPLRSASPAGLWNSAVRSSGLPITVSMPLRRAP